MVGEQLDLLQKSTVYYKYFQFKVIFIHDYWRNDD